MVASTVSAVLGLGLTFESVPIDERVREWVDPEPIVMGEAPPADFVELEPTTEGPVPADLELPSIAQ